MSSPRYICCPVCRGSVLWRDAGEIKCPNCGRLLSGQEREVSYPKEKVVIKPPEEVIRKASKAPRAGSVGFLRRLVSWVGAPVMVVLAFGLVFFALRAFKKDLPPRVADRVTEVEEWFETHSAKPAEWWGGVRQSASAKWKSWRQPKAAPPADASASTPAPAPASPQRPAPASAPASGLAGTETVALPRPDPGPAPAAGSGNDLATMRDTIEPKVASMREMRRAFVTTTRQAGLDRLFDANLLAKEDQFQESNAILTKLDALVDESSNSVRSRLTDLQEAVRQSPVPPDMKQRYLDAVAVESRKESSYWAEAQSLENSISGSLRGLIAFLHETKAARHAEDNRIVFEQASDQSRFEERSKALAALAERWKWLEERFQADVGIPLFPPEEWEAKALVKKKGGK